MVNGTMMQFFHWCTPADGTLWNEQHAGKVFIDILKKHPAEVTIDEGGWAEFHVQAGSVSVWVEKGESV